MRTLVTASLAACIGLVGPISVAADASSPSDTSLEAPTTTPIKHLVVIYQENASFDHYFGTYPIAANPRGDPPFTAREGTPPVNNLLPSPLNGDRDLRTTNPNLSNPFRLDRSEFVTCSQDHSYRAEQRAANQGRMDKFVQQTDNSTCAGLPRPVPTPQAMGYFDGNTVTALWNYAQHFALNDNAFATTYGPSTPGALNLVAGRTSGAVPDNNNKSVTEGVVYGDPDPAYDDCSDPAKLKASLTGTNVGDLLSEAGVSWGWFQGGFSWKDPTGDPAIQCESAHTNLAGIVDSDYEAHHNPFQYFASTSNPHHLPPSSEAMIGEDDQANHQYGLQDFWTAARAGDLPGVSFLKAPAFQDGHPGPANSNPLDEQDFLVDTLNQIQQLPQWSSTAVVLAWDDSDGWYDHQFPPNVHHSHNAALDTLYGVRPAGSTDQTTLMCMAPPGQSLPVDDPSVFEMRCGYGERLPLLVVSPYVQENSVDHTLVDQSSILQFIEDNWGLGRLGQGSFDADAGSLDQVFDFGHQRSDTLILNHLTGNPNTPPTVQDVHLSPGTPRTNDTLSVTAVVGDSDRDVTNDRPDRRDVVHTSYAWFNGNTMLSGIGDTLDLSVPGNGDRGDVITVQVTADDGLDKTTESRTVVVGDSAPEVELGEGSAVVDYSDHLSSVPITTSDPDGDEITVDAVGLPRGLGVNRADDGALQVSGVVDDAAGVYDAWVRVSDGTLDTKTPLVITVTREGAHVAYAGDLLFPTSGRTNSSADVVLRARVTQQDDASPGDLTRAGVEFDLYASSATTGAPDATFATRPDGGGRAEVDIGDLAPGTWTVVVRTDPSGGYFDAPASDEVPVSVYVPRPGSVTGAATVHDPGYRDLPVPIDPDHDRGILGVAASLAKRSGPAGPVLYSFQGADDRAYVVRSTGWEGGGVAITGDRAVVAGTCLVTVVGPSGAVLSRSTGDTFRLDVLDAPGRDGPDGVALSVFTPGGDLYHRVGTPDTLRALSSGQLVIRP